MNPEALFLAGVVFGIGVTATWFKKMMMGLLPPPPPSSHTPPQLKP